MWFVGYGEKGANERDYSSWAFFEVYGHSKPVEHQGVEGYDLAEASRNDIVRAIRENRKPVAYIEVSAAEALTSIVGREAIYQRRTVTLDEMGVSVWRPPSPTGSLGSPCPGIREPGGRAGRHPRRPAAAGAGARKCSRRPAAYRDRCALPASAAGSGRFPVSGAAVPVLRPVAVILDRESPHVLPAGIDVRDRIFVLVVQDVPGVVAELDGVFTHVAHDALAVAPRSCVAAMPLDDDANSIGMRYGCQFPQIPDPDRIAALIDVPERQQERNPRSGGLCDPLRVRSHGVLRGNVDPREHHDRVEDPHLGTDGLADGPYWRKHPFQ